MLRTTRLQRRGFTLVEMMVAAALTVLIMAVLATAFSSGAKTLSHLKSVVGLSEQLRSANTVLARDLSATHLEDETGSSVRVSSPLVTNGGWQAPRKGYFWICQSSPLKQWINPPLTPFAPSANVYPVPGTVTDAYLMEGFEDGIDSCRATDHLMAFTVKLSGKTAADTFSTPCPFPLADGASSRLDFAGPPGGPPVLISQWAEVAYFLIPTAVKTVSEVPGEELTLFTLVRRQRVVAPLEIPLPGSNPVTPPPAPLLYADYPELSIGERVSRGMTTVQTYFANTPESLTRPFLSTPQFDNFTRITDFVAPPTPAPPTVPARPTAFPATFPGAGPFAIAPGLNKIPQNHPQFGGDVVLNNVVSFQIRVQTDSPPGAILPAGLPARSPAITAAPAFKTATEYHDLPEFGPTTNVPATVWPQIYDTATNPVPFNPALPGIPVVTKPRIKSIQIRLRVYDTKNMQTRQMTIVQDL